MARKFWEKEKQVLF